MENPEIFTAQIRGEIERIDIGSLFATAAYLLLRGYLLSLTSSDRQKLREYLQTEEGRRRL